MNGWGEEMSDTNHFLYPRIEAGSMKPHVRNGHTDEL